MERREIIKLVTLATGAVLTIPLSNSLLIACKNVNPIKDSDYVLQYFNTEDYVLLQNILNVILPKTDSPSAVDVGVHQIIDTMVGTVYDPKQKKEFSETYEALNRHLNSGIGLEKLQSLLMSSNEKDEMAKSAFLGLRQQAIAYYLSTKEIATNYLNYLPIPGPYEPCISLESVDGKAWAL